MLAACGDVPLRLAVAFVAATGVGVGEALRLARPDVNLARRSATLRRCPGGEARIVPLCRQAVTILRFALALAPDDRVFPLSAGAFYVRWRRLCANAGVPGLRLRNVRKDAARRWRELGMSATELLRITGEDSPGIRLRYTHADLSQALRRLDACDNQHARRLSAPLPARSRASANVFAFQRLSGR